MLVIYGAPTFNATKIVLTAEELELDYSYNLVDLTKAEHKTPEHLKRHPMGKVPAIEYNGKPLFESNTICRFLASTVDSPLYGGDVYQRALIDQWIDMMGYHAGRWLGVFYFQEFISPKNFNREANQAALLEAKEFLQQQLPIVDQQLGKHKYLAGDNLTIADTIAMSYFYTHEFTSIEIDEYKNISQWYQSIRQNPSFERTKICMDKVHGVLD